MKLSDYIGEATEYDKKEILEERKPKSWLKSVSAFANGIGRALFFGVSNDEVLVGLEDAKGVSEKISEAIKTKMDPAPQVVLRFTQRMARICDLESTCWTGNTLLLYRRRQSYCLCPHWQRERSCKCRGFEAACSAWEAMLLLIAYLHGIPLNLLLLQSCVLFIA